MDSAEKRSLKITNSRQFQILVNLMQENIQLAKGLLASDYGKISSEEAWNDIAREVNLYGPPERTGSEWKKIWGDLKSRTKRKVYENNKTTNVCEEGTYRMLYLSDLEQSVDRIFNFSNTAATQVLDETPKDSTFECVLSDFLEPHYEVKTEPDDTAPNIEILPSSETFTAKKTKSTSQIRLLGKRKHEKTEKQFKLLQQQIKNQEKILEVMQIQAKATNILADAAKRQAEAMEIIADSTHSIALAVQHAVTYLKRD